MDSEFHWPKRGDNPFLKKAAEPLSPTWISFSWLTSLDVDDSLYAGAFKEAADKIITELGRGEDVMSPDRFFMPIVYLYRHALELQLKQLIKIGIDIDLLEGNDKVYSALRNHNLHCLWNYVRVIVENFWPEGPKEDINAAERIIQEFHKIDKSGQSLRYSEDLSGEKTLPRLPESVQLKHLRDVMDGIFNFLWGCQDGLHEAIQTRNEILSEYWGEY